MSFLAHTQGQELDAYHSCDEDLRFTKDFMANYINKVWDTTTVPGGCSASTTYCYEHYLPPGGQPAGTAFELDVQKNYVDTSWHFIGRNVEKVLPTFGGTN